MKEIFQKWNNSSVIYYCSYFIKKKKKNSLFVLEMHDLNKLHILYDAHLSSTLALQLQVYSDSVAFNGEIIIKLKL